MKLGISCGAIVERYGYEKAFELCKKSGFDAVDFDLLPYGEYYNPTDIYHASEEDFEAYFTAIKNKAESMELEISQTHGRCLTYTPDEKDCEYARWVSEKDLLATRVLGASACVIHSIASGWWPDNYQDSDFMHWKNKEFFDYLIPIAEKNNVKFALETFGRAYINGKITADFFAPVKELKKQFDMLDTKNKTICVDTGHTYETVVFGVPGPAEVIRTLGSDVTLLHLHDNNGSYDQHLPPMGLARNGINWEDVFDALEEVGYHGVYNFELYLRHYGECMPEAIHFLGKWLRYFLDNRGRIDE